MACGLLWYTGGHKSCTAVVEVCKCEAVGSGVGLKGAVQCRWCWRTRALLVDRGRWQRWRWRWRLAEAEGQQVRKASLQPCKGSFRFA